MNEAKRARWCNPLEGVQRKGDYDSGYYKFWGGGGGLACVKSAQGGEAAPSIYVYMKNMKEARIVGVEQNQTSNEPKLRTNPKVSGLRRA